MAPLSAEFESHFARAQAALGSYQHNPWLLHLLYKILLGSDGATSEASRNASSAALALLDVDAYPFKRAPPARVRAALFHYDFTRVPSPWARRIPGAKLLPANCSMLGPFAGGSSGTVCGRWWTRSRVQEYLPPLTRSVLEEQVVGPQGWPIGHAVPRPSPCGTSTSVGSSRDAVMPLLVCKAVVAMRGPAAKLQRFVGFYVWGGVFVDGPLIVIATALALPIGLRLLRRTRKLWRGHGAPEKSLD